MKSHILDRLGYVGVLAQEFAQWDDDIISMLGYETPQTYLFILQNAAEKRPNGGFFGSFAVLTIDRGRIERFDILDSYVPGFDRPGASLQGPSWLLHFLPERDVYFVGANKIGFTYHDGAAIQQLYETSYPQQSVRGVIFLTTELFAYMLP
jgi:hypothetical protein